MLSRRNYLNSIDLLVIRDIINSLECFGSIELRSQDDDLMITILTFFLNLRSFDVDIVLMSLIILAWTFQKVKFSLIKQCI